MNITKMGENQEHEEIVKGHFEAWEKQFLKWKRK
jgi:hypothetical protein